MPDLSPDPNAPMQVAMPPSVVEAAAAAPPARRSPAGRGGLPVYSKSLLRIKVPVVVVLASKKQDLSRILELGPGMIIHFDKSCEESLELEVGNHRVAQGEAVKVGEKFGLRITKMVLPEERFHAVGQKK